MQFFSFISVFSANVPTIKEDISEAKRPFMSNGMLESFTLRALMHFFFFYFSILCQSTHQERSQEAIDVKRDATAIHTLDAIGTLLIEPSVSFKSRW